MLLFVLAALTAPPPGPPQAWCGVAPPVAAAGLAALTPRLTRRLDETPQPLGHVHTEHTLAGDPEREASLKAERDLSLMRDAALAWRAGAGDAYRGLAERYLAAWTAAYHPDLNPIDETGFDALVDTYAILSERDAPGAEVGFHPATRRLLTAWARAYVEDIDRGKSSARPAASWANNWQSHRVKLVTMMAVATRDAKLFAAARRLFWDQVDANIARNGEVTDFSQRDALHYVVYDLEPLLQAALAARTEGEDWYHARRPGGASVEAAVGWLAPYARGEKAHEEFVHSTVAFDAERARHGEKGYSGPWAAKSAAAVYWLAAQFDPRYQELARSLGPTPSFVALCGE